MRYLIYFITADHFTSLTSAIYPDSRIAQNSSAKTKATCIVKGALHPHFSELVIRLCQTFPFSILCDESNKDDKKHFDILVCTWGNTIGWPVTRLLDMPVYIIACYC